MEGDGWVISIRRISLGGGWRYLITSVAVGDGAAGHGNDLARYYTESGTPPGRFLGAGLSDLAGGAGIAAGSRVTEEHLARMLATMCDPSTGTPVGKVAKAATGTAGRTPVAGFDLTFSPSKSVSVAWALADQGTKAIIYSCHRRAIDQVLAWAEENVLVSRSGAGGIAEEPVTGAIATAFTHWSSRADDPQLHDHVVIWNRAKSTSDGQWRTLDSRALFKATATLSALHQGALEDLLTGALGVGWQARTRRHSDRPRWEIDGVSEKLMAEFSQRAEKIAEREQQLRERFVAARGRQPSVVEQVRLRQQATLQTRPKKSHASLDDLTAAWRSRADRYVAGPDQVAWVASLAGRGDLPPLRSIDVEEVVVDDAAAAVVNWVAARRASFSRMNLAAEANRLLHGVVFTTPGERQQVAQRITAVAVGMSVPLSAQPITRTPRVYQRDDGTSRLQPASRLSYTCQQLLDAEARLLATGRTTTGPSINPRLAAAVLQAPVPGRGYRLSGDQRDAVAQIATSGRLVDVLVGPAGAGKTAALAGLRQVWEAEHGPGTVVGLATSANAADILGKELGVGTDNTAKWLTTYRSVPELAARADQLATRLAAHRYPRSAAAVRLRDELDHTRRQIASRRPQAGQLFLVDEASLAATLALDELATATATAGAKLLLVGDSAQIQAVDAGGAFTMLAGDRGDDVPHLDHIRRFTAAWERKASIQLRAGDPAALSAYQQHDRITGGERDVMLGALYQGWRSDIAAGKTSLMIAADTGTVAELNTLARAGRIADGQVTPGGIPIADGGLAGVGDVVITRKNNRAITVDDGGWVKNGQCWTVVATSDDGSMTVTPTTSDTAQQGEGAVAVRVVLPADYVTAHVQLGYAITAMRAEGATVDTGHGYIHPATGREDFYVLATRGRQSNRLYVDTRYDPDPATGHDKLTETRDTLEVLTAVLARDPAEMAAHDMLARAHAHERALSTLVAEYTTITATSHTAHWETVLDTCPLSDAQRQQMRDSAAYGPLLAACRDAAARGLPIEGALPTLIAGRNLHDASDIAAVLHQRVEDWAVAATPSSRGGQPGLIVGLIPRATGVDDDDLAAALADRDRAITTGAHQLVEAALTQDRPWIARLGPPPADPDLRRRWQQEAATVAAYRDLHHIGDHRHPLGDPAMARTTEQVTHRQRAVAAARRAATLASRGSDQADGTGHDITIDPKQEVAL